MQNDDINNRFNLKVSVLLTDCITTAIQQCLFKNKVTKPLAITHKCLLTVSILLVEVQDSFGK